MFIRLITFWENVAVLKHIFCNSTHSTQGAAGKCSSLETNSLLFYSFCHGAERKICSFTANFMQFYQFCHRVEVNVISF